MHRLTANRRLSSDSYSAIRLIRGARASSIGAARCCDDAVVARRVARRGLPRCPRERTIAGDWPTDNRAGGVANPAASEGGATPPEGPTANRVPGRARPSDGVAPPSHVCAHCLIGDGTNLMAPRAPRETSGVTVPWGETAHRPPYARAPVLLE